MTARPKQCTSDIYIIYCSVLHNLIIWCRIECSESQTKLHILAFHTLIEPLFGCYSVDLGRQEKGEMKNTEVSAINSRFFLNQFTATAFKISIEMLRTIHFTGENQIKVQLVNIYTCNHLLPDWLPFTTIMSGSFWSNTLHFTQEKKLMVVLHLFYVDHFGSFPKIGSVVILNKSFDTSPSLQF